MGSINTMKKSNASMAKKLTAGFCALLLLGGCGKTPVPHKMAVEPPEEAPAQAAEPSRPPASPPADNRFDALAEQLDALLQAYAQDDGSWSIYLWDTETEQEVSLSAHPMESASLIKLFVACAVQENRALVDGQQSYTGETAALLLDMLSVSDNDATNALVHRLGSGDAAAGMACVNAFCQANGFADTHMGRLMLDFDANDDNFTSAKDCCAILNRILDGEAAGAAELLDALRRQQRTEKIPAGVPEDISTANKTGELTDVENDAAIVWTENGAYILCVMSGDLSDTASARSHIVTLSQTVYDFMTKK